MKIPNPNTKYEKRNTKYAEREAHSSFVRSPCAPLMRAMNIALKKSTEVDKIKFNTLTVLYSVSLLILIYNNRNAALKATFTIVQHLIS